MRRWQPAQRHLLTPARSVPTTPCCPGWCRAGGERGAAGWKISARRCPWVNEATPTTGCVVPPWGGEHEALCWMAASRPVEPPAGDLRPVPPDWACGPRGPEVGDETVPYWWGEWWRWLSQAEVSPETEDLVWAGERFLRRVKCKKVQIKIL